MASFEIIVLLMWIIATATSTTSTGQQCECHVNEQLHINELLCRERKLTALPDLGSLECQAESIDLSHNQLSILPGNVFTATPRIKRVFLYLNNLDAVHRDAFKTLVDLRFVDLSHNDLLDVDADWFTANHRLEKVILSGNPLVDVSTTSPLLISDSISQLDLSECKLAVLTREMLSRLPALEALDVSSNSLELVGVHTFQSVPLLTRLMINNNRWKCDCALRDLMNFKMATTELTAVPEKQVRCFTPQRRMITWSQDAETRYCLPASSNIDAPSRNRNLPSSTPPSDVIRTPPSDIPGVIEGNSQTIYAVLLVLVLFTITIGLATFTVQLVKKTCQSPPASSSQPAVNKVHNRDNHSYMLSNNPLKDTEQLMPREVVPVYSDILPLNFQHPARSLVHIYEPVGKVVAGKK